MSDDEYEIPLVDQPYFGAGIKRKRIHFVPSTSTGEPPGRSSITSPGPSAADKYLSIVLGRNEEPVKNEVPSHDTETSATDAAEPPAINEHTSNEDAICDICKGPLDDGALSKGHDLSIVHQICLKHSHPPSHLDRNSKALAVLRSQGWDPDSRLGLGATGEGMLYPLKAQENPRRVGLGAVLAEVQAKPKPVKLDAGKVRKLDQQSRKEKDKLRDLFYRNEDIAKYLGDG